MSLREHRQPTSLLTLFGLFIFTGCLSLWPAGKSPAAKSAFKESQPVIDALNLFFEANGEFPAKLQELVPDYLDHLPTVVRLYKGNGSDYEIAIGFSPTLSTLRVSCWKTKDTEWDCVGYL